MDDLKKHIARAQRERAQITKLSKTCTGSDTVISQAARELGRRPKDLIRGRRRSPRRWTGFLRGERCWVGRLVILADGTSGFIQKVVRNMVFVTIFSPEHGLETNRYTNPDRLCLWRMPEAALLGARKRGKKEQPSQKKAESSRLNGSCPVRPGRRPRGRPKKSAKPTPPPEESTERLLARLQKARAQEQEFYQQLAADMQASSSCL